MMLTSAPNLLNAHVVQSAVGAIALFYWLTFIIRLTFGSFIIAVINGSFNATRKAVDEEDVEMERLPDGYESCAMGDRMSRRDLLWYLLTWRAYGTWHPRLFRSPGERDGEGRREAQ